MVSATQSERDELISEFWRAVRERLISEHRREPMQADFGIGRYRHEMEGHGIGDTVYNQGVELTAEVVDGLIDRHD